MLSWLGLTDQKAQLLASAARAPETAGQRLSIRSPWSDGNLTPVLAKEILGVVAPPALTREVAMSVPAVARCRHLIVSSLASMPLRALDKNGLLAEQPRWLSATNGLLPPQHRVGAMVDDLLFHGGSLLAVERGYGGAILDAVRVLPEEWSIDADGRILVRGSEVDADSVVYVPGLHEGILSFGRDSIRTAKELERALAQRLSARLALVELHQTTDDELEDDEIDALLDGYIAARQDARGAVMYTPTGIDVRVHGESPIGDGMVDVRNLSAVDIARLVGVPASMIDATGVAASLTYETTEGRNLQYYEQLSLYTTAIEARLSMDDVTPRGTRIRFDRGNVGPIATTGVPTDD